MTKITFALLWNREEFFHWIMCYHLIDVYVSKDEGI